MPETEAASRTYLRWIGFAVIAVVAIGVVAFVLLTADTRPDELRDATWKLAYYRDPSGRERQVMPRSAATMRFERSEIAGNGGNNGFTASYAIDGDSLEIGPIETGDDVGFGAVMREESAFFAGLEATASYRFSDGQLELLDSDGERVLLLTETEGSGN
ncbi:MAG: META domain-containing protein [Coriobacteriia bacterium]|nr:META domain-containing protein [Coriobacteriia bacterium]